MSNKEPDRFKSDLQHMASGYELQVQQEVFNLLMDKRAHQNKQKRKRAIAYFAVSLLLVVGSVFATIYITKPSKLAFTSVANLPVKNQPNKLSSSKKINPNINRGSAGASEVEKTQAYQPNIKHTTYQQQKATLTPNTKVEQTQLAEMPLKKTVKSKWSNQISKPKKEADLATPLNAPINPNNAIEGAKSSNGLIPEQPIFITQNDTSVEKADSLDVKEQIAITTDSATKNLVLNDTAANKPSIEQRKWRPSFWINTTWYPISSLKNDNNKLPNHLADSFGLSNAAHSSVTFSAGVLLPINKSWSVGVGFGYYQFSFDRVRATSLPTDSNYEGLVTSVATKNGLAYSNFTSEIMLKYIEVPVFVRWEKQSKSTLRPFIQSGFTYDYLLSSSSYVFESKPTGEIDYSEKQNVQQEQFNKHRFGVQLEGGYMYQLNRFIAVQAGVVAKQDLRSLYIDNASANQGTYVGLRVGLKINLQ